jgi:hypothetical protein
MERPAALAGRLPLQQGRRDDLDLVKLERSSRAFFDGSDRQRSAASLGSDADAALHRSARRAAERERIAGLSASGDRHQKDQQSSGRNNRHCQSDALLEGCQLARPSTAAILKSRVEQRETEHQWSSDCLKDPQHARTSYLFRHLTASAQSSSSADGSMSCEVIPPHWARSAARRHVSCSNSFMAKPSSPSKHNADRGRP